jgi:hypothetical protein
LYKVEFEAGTEDVIINKRKSKLKLEDEFLYDLLKKDRFDDAIRRKKQHIDEIGNMQ